MASASLGEQRSSEADAFHRARHAESDKAGTARRININQATLQELRMLPGIGEAIARRILEYRRKNPPFRKIEELLIIRGISRNRLERFRNQICVN
jgi:competence protein ComEA